MDEQYLPTNVKVRIAKLQSDFSSAQLIEGNVLVSGKLFKAVRFFSPPLTSKGREYLSDKMLLTPHGITQRIYCLPSTDLIPASTQKSEKQNERRQKGKARSKTT